MKSGGQATLLAPQFEKVRGQLPPPCPSGSAVYGGGCFTNMIEIRYFKTCRTRSFVVFNRM